MIEKIMFWAILGHFVGDYLMQSKKMALGKTCPGWPGAFRCAQHCLYYTWAVMMAVVIGQNSWGTSSNIWIWPMVFLTHYPIDRWSLADKLLELINGRRLRELVESKEARQWQMEYLDNVAIVSTTQAFAALVYTVVDNTMHIILMTAGFAALLHWGVI